MYLRSRSLHHLCIHTLRIKIRSSAMLQRRSWQKHQVSGELLLVEGLLRDKVCLAITHGLSLVGPACIRTLMLALSDQNDAVSKSAARVIVNFGLEAITEE